MGSAAVARDSGVSGSVAPRMWDLLGPGIEPVFPGFFTTEPGPKDNTLMSESSVLPFSH